MSDKIYIVAGNNREFVEYVRRKCGERWSQGETSVSMSDYVYVSNADRLCGLYHIKGFYIGTYMLRPDIDEIKERIRLTKLVDNNV